MPKKPYTITRFGCRTCKQRKIRCDEKQPTCGNCAKAGRPCQRAVGCPSSSSARDAIFTGPLTLFHFGPLRQHSIRHDEVTYLDTFRNKLIEDIVGNFSRPAWRRLILQSIHDEAAVCHLAVAYGALNHVQDRPQHHNTPKRTNMELVFQHYNKGMSYMQRIIDDTNQNRSNVVLLCAFLCICFEIRYGRPYMSLLHFHHSLKILANTLQADDDIILAFTKMDILASVSLRHHTPATDLDRFSGISDSGSDREWEAEHNFTVLLGRLCVFIRTEVDPIRYGDTCKAMPLHIITTANLFNNKLDNFRDTHLEQAFPDNKISSQLQLKRRLLWLKYLAAIILLRPCFSMEEKVFDSLLPEFSSIVCLSEAMASSGQPPFHERHELNFDMGVIHPLFKVATKCRSPQIRRKAIGLLDIAASSEGSWDAPAYKAYAERTMQVEEEGLHLSASDLDDLEPSIVSEASRVHTLEIWPKGETSSTVTFRTRPHGVGTEWVDATEIVTW